MRKKDVIEYYGGSQSKAARALGLTRAAISIWPELVPLAPAYRIQVLTNNKLKVDPTLYRKAKRT